MTTTSTRDRPADVTPTVGAVPVAADRAAPSPARSPAPDPGAAPFATVLCVDFYGAAGRRDATGGASHGRATRT